MLVQSRSSTPFNKRERSVSPIRSFDIPRFKAAAGALLRYPSSTQIPQQIRTLRQINSTTAACNLPEDLLSKIFLHCAHSCLPKQIVDEDAGWSWITVSFVCFRWRTVALGNSDLWTNVDFSHPKWAAISLQRAKMSPLHITATVNDRNVRYIHRSLQLAHRIQDIHLHASIQRIYPLLQILAHPNPALESLIVDVQIPRSYSDVQTYDSPTFPTSGPPLKNLHYMELRSAPFYLLTSRCTFLTQFHLHDLPLSERPTIRYFLFMIEQLKHLEYLTLDRSFPINLDQSDVRSLEKRITLPKLKLISLVGSAPDIANILGCITLPPSTRLVVHICTLADWAVYSPRLSQSIGSHSWGAFHGLPLETLVLSGHGSGPRHLPDTLITHPDFRQSIRIRAFRADCDGRAAAVDVTINPDESIHDDEPFITTLSAIWKALALSQIRTLALQDVDIVTQKTWHTFLRSISALRTLDITGRAPCGLVWAMLLNARSHRTGGERLLVPLLDDVYLHGVDCSSGGYMVSRTAHVNSHCDFDDSRFLDVLNASLVERRNFGLCLRSLSISRCQYVVQSSIDDARRIVSHFISDIRRLCLVKNEEVRQDSTARYHDRWDFEHPDISHFYRLRTLVEMD
ncbi:hypothetical protein CPB83DRAFT_810399 [Crepidotus variabilis]|uniref:F-box domain-containing protein n=1 Tax=Crepidotus variabilis TaxID=179855 RepID=A0A9P6EL22_9AGAR|nr:hypothetical protein CPB83DRAFT_810399 [Crepidotus variabilis]